MQGKEDDSIIKNITFIIRNPFEEWDLINKVIHKKRNALYRLKQYWKRKRLKLKGSLVVEAAAVLPIFLLAMAHLIYWISFLDIERGLSSEVNERARRLAKESFVLDATSEEWIEVTKGETLRGRYYLRIAKAKPFTGRYYTNPAMSKEESRLVFVTKTGRVFHRSFSCPYIKLSVKAVGRAQVGEKRSDNGEKYRPCELCAPGKDGGRVFITTYGNRFHRDRSCKSLKREIKIVTLKKAREKGLGACSKCGGRDD